MTARRFFDDAQLELGLLPLGVDAGVVTYLTDAFWGIVNTIQTTAWSPLDLPWMIAWHDASDAGSFSYSSGVTISQWNDLSGNGFHLTPQGSSPVTRDGTVNGLDSVVFTGSFDDRLQNAVSSYTHGQPITVYAVVRPSSLPASTQSFYTLASGLSLRITSGGYYAMDAGTTLTGSAAAVVGETAVVVGVFNGASSKLYVNGVEVASGNPNSNGTTRGPSVGGSTENYEVFYGDACEFFTAATLSDPADITLATDYLMAKWIPVP